jgi:proteasome lid subunit RPN8/RPN11
MGFMQCPFCHQQTWFPYGADNGYFKDLQKKTTCTKCGALLFNKKGNDKMVVPANNSGQSGDHWETKIDTIHDCSKAPKEIVCKVDLLAKMKIDSLMEEYKSIEWLAYLIGKPEQRIPAEKEGEEDEVIPADPLHIIDIEIPEQEVSSTRVDKIECDNFNELNVVGVIHSHHGMGTGFSGTDHEFINGNHNLSLVIAKNGVAGQYRWTTPCGALKVIDDVKVKVVYPNFPFDKKEWLKGVTPNIKKYTYTAPSQNWTGYGQGGYGYGVQSRQQQYVNGVATPRTQDDDDTWETNNDDAPEYDTHQSLSDALAEAFD